MSAIDKEELLSRYRHKFVVVVKDGLDTGLCGDSGDSVYNRIFDFDRVKKASEPFSDCRAEPMHKGEVLKVNHVSFRSGYLLLDLSNVSPHVVARGIGAFAHESMELGRAHVTTQAGNGGKDLDTAEALITKWLKPFDTAADAAKLGNTASGVFVKQVNAGMTFLEVESVLGVPQTRVDLGDKILYRYKDLTVEFHGGKVTDVR